MKKETQFDAGEIDMNDLESMFGADEAEIIQMENTVLSQSLEGFAAFFPDWDVLPPSDIIRNK